MEFYHSLAGHTRSLGIILDHLTQLQFSRFDVLLSKA